MHHYVIYTWNNLKHRKMRSWLTISGIVIGIAAIIALISLSQGMENALTEQFSRLGSDLIQVVPANLRGPPTGEHNLPNNLVETVARMKEVDYANPLVLNFATVEYQKEKSFIFVNGYDTTLSGKGFIDADINIEEGRLFNPGEQGVAVIGWDVANDIFTIRAKNSILIDEKKFRVIGIFERSGTPLDDRVFIPLEDARLLFNQHDTVNVIAVKLKPNVDPTVAQVRIQKELERKIDKEKFTLFTADQILEQFGVILGVMQAVLVGIAAISLLVGAIGIMNSMFTSVLERTREIGIMKAIGATNSTILTMFVIESASIGLFGGVMGVIIGALGAKGIGYIITQSGFALMKVTIDAQLIIFTLIFAVFVGILSGAIPAYKASRLQPVDALRYE